MVYGCTCGQVCQSDWCLDPHTHLARALLALHGSAFRHLMTRLVSAHQLPPGAVMPPSLMVRYGCGIGEACAMAPSQQAGHMQRCLIG